MFNLEDGKAITTKKRNGKKGKKENDTEKRETVNQGKQKTALSNIKMNKPQAGLIKTETEKAKIEEGKKVNTRTKKGQQIH